MSKFKTWWRNLWMDPYTKYLSQATDHVDLEQRLRTLQRKGIWI
jgi:hypothetical protein